MIQEGIQKAIIFEDDIHIEDDFSSLIQAIDYFPDDWELVLLGYHRGSARRDKKAKSYLRFQKKITDKHKLVRLAEVGTGSHGYLINLKGAKKLVEELSPIRIPMDYYTGDDQYINLYAISPRVIRVNNILDAQSNLTLERDKLAKEYNHIFYKRKETTLNKIIREFLRPFKQLLFNIKRVFGPLKKYR